MGFEVLTLITVKINIFGMKLFLIYLILPAALWPRGRLSL
jgi:hypothetical protein